MNKKSFAFRSKKAKHNSPPPDDEEEDPLDAFMQDLNKEANKDLRESEKKQATALDEKGTFSLKFYNNLIIQSTLPLGRVNGLGKITGELTV